ncbi:hypothetical protein M513_13788 [Trichuris suis]|uniref:RNase NYN domain-containing protein n=1 Tax=Trichuris suis TaxID=68888 RepID=A0A085LK38_9BILA|nr:hypothetical protein M513_13788 [Trichuris suis]
MEGSINGAAMKRLSAKTTINAPSTASQVALKGRVERELFVNGATQDLNNVFDVAALVRLGGPEKISITFPWNEPFPTTNADLSGPLSEMYSDECEWDNGFRYTPASRLRPIVLDGSNLAFAYGKGTTFSAQGILKALKYFLVRKHPVVAFISRSFVECGSMHVVKGRQALIRLARCGLVVLTPTGMSYNNERWECYNCREGKFIIKEAYETGALIISNDSYNDLQLAMTSFDRTVKNRTLHYRFNRNGEFELVLPARLKQVVSVESLLKFYARERVKVVVEQRKDEEIKKLVEEIDVLVHSVEAKP